MYRVPIFSILWVGRTTSEHSFWVRVLYFKKQPIPPPCCLAFYIEYNINERDQINSLREQHPLCTEQLPNGSPIHPPLACASNLFWGPFRECRSNRTTRSLRFPTSLLTLLVCDNYEVDFKAILILLGTGLWTLRCMSQRPLNVCYMVLPLQHSCITFKLASRTAFSCLKLAESPLWLVDFMPCWGGALWLADSPHPDLPCHLCVPRGLQCGDAMIHWINVSWLAKLQLDQVPLAELWLWDTSTTPALATCLAARSGLCDRLGRVLSSLSVILKLCQEAWEIFSHWCWSAKGRKYKTKDLSATKCNRQSFINVVYMLITCPAFGLLLSCWVLFLLLLEQFVSESFPSRAGFFPQLGLILPCFLMPQSSYFSPLSHAVAEEIRLLSTFRKHAHLLHEI